MITQAYKIKGSKRYKKQRSGVRLATLWPQATHSAWTEGKL